MAKRGVAGAGALPSTLAFKFYQRATCRDAFFLSTISFRIPKQALALSSCLYCPSVMHKAHQNNAVRCFFVPRNSWKPPLNFNVKLPEKEEYHATAPKQSLLFLPLSRRSRSGCRRCWSLAAGWEAPRASPRGPRKRSLGLGHAMLQPANQRTGLVLRGWGSRHTDRRRAIAESAAPAQQQPAGADA